jgi:hypothetical protein
LFQVLPKLTLTVTTLVGDCPCPLVLQQLRFLECEASVQVGFAARSLLTDERFLHLEPGLLQIKEMLGIFAPAREAEYGGIGFENPVALFCKGEIAEFGFIPLEDFVLFVGVVSRYRRADRL